MFGRIITLTTFYTSLKLKLKRNYGKIDPFSTWYKIKNKHSHKEDYSKENKETFWHSLSKAF